MFDVDDTAPDTPAPRELSQDVQALINNGLDFLDKAREELEASKPKFLRRQFLDCGRDFTESSAGARTLVVGLQPEKANKKAGLPSR